MSMRRRLANFIARLRANEDGNVLVLTAFASTALCASLALALDYGSVYYAKRKVQAAVDMAAMAGAQATADSAAVARESLTRNGFASPEQLTVEVGNYTASREVAVGSRFTPNTPPPPNAVRVTMSTHAPLYFGRAISGRDSIELRASAVAATSQMAKFSIGVRLISVEGSLANAVLSSVFGNTVALSASDYDALTADRVDAFQLSRALAQQLNRPTATFGQLASASMSVGDVYNALATVGRSGALSASSTTAIDSLAVVPGTAGVTLSLGKLVGYGPYAPQAVADSPSASVSVGLMDLIMAAAMIGNGSRQIAIDLGSSVSGVAGAKVYVSASEHTAEQPWLSLGDKDAVVRTAQTRLLVEASVAGVDALTGRTLALPLYVDVAASEARIGSIACSRDGTAGTAVALAVLPGPAGLQIGSVAPSSLTSFAGTPGVSAATLLSEATVTVTGAAQLAGATATEQTVSFSKAEIDALTAKTIASPSATTSPATSLAANLELSVQVSGFGTGVDGVRSAVTASLTPALAPLDNIINAVLGLAGVRLGQVDVMVNGLRCDGAVLVQ